MLIEFYILFCSFYNYFSLTGFRTVENKTSYLIFGNQALLGYVWFFYP
jgi:hypothetical protein